jgi:hypothetical protein
MNSTEKKVIYHKNFSAVDKGRDYSRKQENEDSENQSIYQANSTDTDSIGLLNQTQKMAEIVSSSKINELKWNKQKMIYKVTEFSVFVASLLITTFSLWFSVWLLFFPEYQIINEHFILMKNILNIGDLIPTLAVFYFVIEALSLTLEIAKGIVLLKVFLVFRNGDKVNLSSYSKYSEEINENKTVIDNLRHRVIVRKRLKSVLTFLISYETIINLFVFTLVVFPKLFAGIYIEIKLNKILNTQIFTTERNTLILDLNYSAFFPPKKQLNIIPNNNHPYQCCNTTVDSFNKNETILSIEYLNECNSNTSFKCFYSIAHFILKTIVIVFFITSILKFFFQSFFIINLRYLLIHPLIKKRQLKEKKMLKTYESYKRGNFQDKIKAIIEKNDKSLSKYILNSSSTSELSPLDKSKSQIQKVSFDTEKPSSVALSKQNRFPEKSSKSKVQFQFEKPRYFNEEDYYDSEANEITKLDEYSNNKSENLISKDVSESGKKLEFSWNRAYNAQNEYVENLNSKAFKIINSDNRSLVNPSIRKNNNYEFIGSKLLNESDLINKRDYTDMLINKKKTEGGENENYDQILKVPKSEKKEIERRHTYFSLKNAERKIENIDLKFYSSIAEYKLKKRQSFL